MQAKIAHQIFSQPAEPHPDLPGSGRGGIPQKSASCWGHACSNALRPNTRVSNIARADSRRIHADHEGSRQDIFGCREMFYSPKRRDSHADGRSPVQFEQQYFKRLETVY